MNVLVDKVGAIFVVAAGNEMVMAPSNLFEKIRILALILAVRSTPVRLRSLNTRQNLAA